MTRERIEKAVNVINYAIKHNISVKEASIKCGYANTYVKNIKAILNEKYKNNTIDDELFSFFMDKYEEYENIRNEKKDKYNKSKTKVKPIIGEKFSFNVEGKTANANWVGDLNKLNELLDNKNESNLNNEKFHKGYPENHIKTVDQLLNKCNVNRDIWDVIDYTVNKWDVTSWKMGYPQTWENFQVKARLRLKEAEAKAKSAAEIFRQMTKNYSPPKTEITKLINKVKTEHYNNEKNILEICLFDLHFGKLAWNGETGENYDTKIAKKRFIYALLKLLKRAEAFSFERILFPIGNDFFNSDTIFNTTTQGTLQDEDLRWQKTFKAGCELLIDGINILKSVGVPIDILIIPGNHDFERSFYMGSFLDAWFRDDTQVNVNNGANPRKYYRWGKVLLGFTHGKDEKENSLAMLMAKDKESKKYWSDTYFHEWHLGHFHRKITKRFTLLDKTGYVQEDDGVIIRYLSSLTGTEEWHFKKGYVGQVKAGEAFIWNDNLGMIGHLNSNYIFDGDVEENNDVNKLLNM